MSTVTDPKTERLIAELYKVEGKAEIVDGKIVHMSPTGFEPGNAAGAIYVSLRQFIKEAGLTGVAVPDNVGFLTDLPNRKSFCPDAAYHTGPRTGMKFLSQPPDFAAEVRSEGDYGIGAERAMAKKRADYFAAGTKVVWDVDLQSDEAVRVYRASSPDTPTIYRRGETAEAEPAVPRWTMPVDQLFE
ncbi:MAG: Uma2 family endonuclease [Pirellulales bacterium]|nr:Uma2 family endonuclease [Pirellulales bacterium]